MFKIYEKGKVYLCLYIAAQVRDVALDTFFDRGQRKYPTSPSLFSEVASEVRHTQPGNNTCVIDRAALIRNTSPTISKTWRVL